MIEPEIDHHLFELARAVERAQHPRQGRLAHDDAGGLAARLGFVRRRLHPAAREPRPIADEELDRVEAQRLQLRQPRGKLRRLGEYLGVELLGDIALDADASDVGQILSPRTESEAIEDVEDLTVAGRLGGLGQKRAGR